MSRHMNAESVAVYLEARQILALIGPDPDAERHMQELCTELGITCRIDGCQTETCANGLCQNHYRRHLRATRNEARAINRKATP